MGVRLAAWVLGAMAILAVVAADPAGWSPFGPSKWLAVSTLGVLGVGLTFCCSPKCHRRAARRSWWLWLALVSLLTVAALMSGDARTAVVGTSERHFGLLTWLLLWGTFVAGQRFGPNERRLVQMAMAIGAALLGVWSLVELLLGEALIPIATDTRRLTGPFGSAAYLGAAACLFVPAAADVAVQATMPRWARVVGIVGASTGMVALLGSGNRAAWFGIACASLAVTVCVRRRRRQVRRFALAGLVVLAVAFAFVAPRLGDVVQRDHGASSRLDEWRVATTVITRHPLLGVGPEGYRIAVAEGVDADYERTYPRTTVLPDRAHSGPLDVALAGGVGAAVLYMALLVGVALSGLRQVRRGRLDAATTGMVACVVAYGAQQLLLFPIAELDPLFWLCAGMIAASRAPATAAPPAVRFAERVVGATAVVLSVAALVFGVLDVAADRLVKDALTESDHPAPGGDGGVHDALRAVDLRPDGVRYRLLAAAMLARRGSLADVDQALDEVAAARSWSGSDPMVLDAGAALLTQRARITGSSDDEQAALVAWQANVHRDPHRARWQLELGRAAALAGDDRTARTAWQNAAALDPSDPTATDLLDELDRR